MLGQDPVHRVVEDRVRVVAHFVARLGADVRDVKLGVVAGTLKRRTGCGVKPERRFRDVYDPIYLSLFSITDGSNLRCDFRHHICCNYIFSSYNLRLLIYYFIWNKFYSIKCAGLEFEFTPSRTLMSTHNH